MSYTYNTQNQVTRINDAAVNPNGPHGDKDLKGFVYDFNVGAIDNDHYTYDYNGNLKVDKHKEITNITYNYLNLPEVITFTGNRTITFVYDAMGTKLQKIVKNNTAPAEVYNYVNGVEYKDNVLQRIAHTEGSISRQDDGSYLHEYVLRDHLGNARVTFTDANNDGTVGVSDMKQINHYYPFGLNMEGNWNGSFADVKNKYQYNGKELNGDFGLNWNDYGARFYDPAIARFTAVDPLADIYSFQSPFAYAANNPVNFRDFMGMGPEDWKNAGADGLSNEQWIAANRNADGEQNSRMNAARQGNLGEEREYKRNQSRDVTDDDIAESHSPATGTRAYVNGEYVGGTCDCGCPGKPPCKGQTSVKMKYAVNGATAPLREPYTGFWGNLDYYLNGGIDNGYKYDKNGYPLFYAPQMGMPPSIAIPNLGLITSGRTLANSLEESLAMKEIMSNPQLGQVVMTGLKDARLVDWSKMQ